MGNKASIQTEYAVFRDDIPAKEGYSRELV